MNYKIIKLLKNKKYKRKLIMRLMMMKNNKKKTKKKKLKKINMKCNNRDKGGIHNKRQHREHNS